MSRLERAFRAALERLRWHDIAKERPSKSTNDQLLALTSNYDGYVREEAVRKLAERRSAKAIPFLIIRANDWVPEVRQAARDALLSLCVPENAAEFVAQLPQLFHLRNCMRGQHEHLIDQICAFLTAAPNHEHVLNGFRSADNRTARACAQLAVQYQLQPLQDIIESSLEHSDVIIRLRAAQLIEKLPAEQQASAFNSAAHDAFTPIRTLALRWFIAEGAEIAVIERFLFDRQPTVRQLAIRELRQRGSNPAERYIQALPTAKTHHLIATLWGLAELSQRQYLNEIKQHLGTDQPPRLRRQALRSSAKLDPDNVQPVLKEALKSESRSLSKEAVRLILKADLTLSSNELVETFCMAEASHVQDACLRLAEHADKWEHLLFILMLAEHHMGDIPTLISRWDKRSRNSYISPSAGQAAQLRSLLTTEIVALSGELQFMLHVHNIADSVPLPTKGSRRQ